MDLKSKRLYKSRRNRMIDGVCGGLAEYLNVDATIVRIAWVVVTLMGGAGIILYIAAIIIIPVNPEHIAPPATPPAPPPSGKRGARKKKGQKESSSSSSPESSAPANATESGTDVRKFWGVLFVIVGALILLSNLGFFHMFWFGWWNFSWTVVFPIILVLAGAALIYHSYSQSRGEASSASGGAAGAAGEIPAVRELRRSNTDKKIFGVCGGLANYLNIDPALVRLVFVILTLASFGIGILIYVLMAIVMPSEK